MKTGKPFFKRILRRLFFLSLLLFVGLCFYQIRHLRASTRDAISTPQSREQGSQKKKHRVRNRVLTWMSNRVNRRKSRNFSKADGKFSLSQQHASLWVTTETPGSITSKYDYAAADGPAVIEPSPGSPLSETKATQPVLSNLMSEIPQDILAGMTSDQVQALSDLTSGMSVAEVMAKFKDDKSFRQNMENLSGTTARKITYLPSDKQ